MRKPRKYKVKDTHARCELRGWGYVNGPEIKIEAYLKNFKQIKRLNEWLAEASIWMLYKENVKATSQAEEGE